VFAGPTRSNCCPFKEEPLSQSTDYSLTQCNEHGIYLATKEMLHKNNEYQLNSSA